MNSKILLPISLMMVLSASMTSCDNDQDKIPGVPTEAKATGYVRDTNGNPIANVQVTDGVTIAVTDSKGHFSFDVSPTAPYIYYSLPAGYEVDLSTTDRPTFYQATQYWGESKDYNFTLKKSSTDENEFTLFTLGDPQTYDAATIARYNTEVAPDILEYSKGISGAKYAIGLGDIVSNQWELYPEMEEAMTATNHGMPVFQIMGNHDHNWNATGDYAHDYKLAFGPSYYSFNRGQVHFLILDDSQADKTQSVGYNCGLDDTQTAWALQDLSNVSKDKLIILCMHIPYNTTYAASFDNGNLKSVVEACAGFANFTIMSAHRHNHNNQFNTINGVDYYEHNHGATCGAHWKSTLNLDGTPIGYGVFTISGNEITNWIYKSVRYDDSFQMRLYNASGQWGDYKFAKTGANRVIVNVWNSDPEWRVVAVEDGVETDITSTLYTDLDAWASGYHVNIKSQAVSPYGSTKKKHFYTYVRKSLTSDFKVVATDRFGRTYEQSDIIDSGDILLAGQYPY